MVLDLRHIDEFPAHLVVKAGKSEFAPFADEVIDVVAVELEADVQKTGEEFFIQGNVEAEVTLECARCAHQFTTRLEEQTDFIAGASEFAKDEPTDTEDRVYFSGSDYRVDVTEPVRQALILSLSLRPLCSEDCKGLCPTCGINLNERTCACAQERIDPRWEALRDLRNGGANSHRG